MTLIDNLHDFGSTYSSSVNANNPKTTAGKASKTLTPTTASSPSSPNLKDKMLDQLQQKVSSITNLRKSTSQQNLDLTNKEIAAITKPNATISDESFPKGLKNSISAEERIQIELDKLAGGTAANQSAKIAAQKASIANNLTSTIKESAIPKGSQNGLSAEARYAVLTNQEKSSSKLEPPLTPLKSGRNDEYIQDDVRAEARRQTELDKTAGSNPGGAPKAEQKGLSAEARDNPQLKPPLKSGRNDGYIQDDLKAEAKRQTELDKTAGSNPGGAPKAEQKGLSAEARDNPQLKPPLKSGRNDGYIQDDLKAEAKRQTELDKAAGEYPQGQNPGDGGQEPQQPNGEPQNPDGEPQQPQDPNPPKNPKKPKEPNGDPQVPQNPGNGATILFGLAQVQEYASKLREATEMIRTSWNEISQTELNKLSNVWVGTDATAYIESVRAYDAKVSASCDALNVLADTYTKASEELSDTTGTLTSELKSL